MNKYFIQLSPKQFGQVLAILGEKATGYENKVNKLIKNCSRSTTNPIGDIDIANGILFQGNILVEMDT